MLTSWAALTQMAERGDYPALVAAAYLAPNARTDWNSEGCWEIQVDGEHFCFVTIHEVPALGGSS